MLNSGTTTVELSKFLYGVGRALVCDEYLVGVSAPVSKAEEACSPRKVEMLWVHSEAL